MAIGVDIADNPGYVGSETLAELAAITRRLKTRTLDLLGIKPGDRVLDLGCGPGIDTIATAQLVGQKGFVTGIDHDEGMIREASEAARRSGLASRIEHIVADACSIPCDTATFDASRSERLLQHVPRPSAAFAEMVRVTKPGGRIAVADADWGSLSIDTHETGIERQICRALPGLMPSGYAGRELFRLFREQCLGDLTVELSPIVWTDYTTFRRTSLSVRDVDQRLVDSGAVSWEEWYRFLECLEEADRQGYFFATANMVLVAGTRPD